MERGSKAAKLRKAGIEESDIPEYLGEIECFGIYPENADACEWFLRMERRWVIAEMSGRHVRFDDHALESQMKLRGIKKKHRAELLDQLMVMESAALEVLNKPEK